MASQQATGVDRTPVDPTPLLTYAASQHYASLYNPDAEYSLKKRLSQATFTLSKEPPPDANCAQTLGAKRFAFLLDDLGGLYSNMGDDAKAAETYSKAIACNPRAEFLHAQLAAALLGMGHYDEARLETQRQLTLGRANFSVYTLLTQLDFIQDRWQEAVTHARLAATEAPDDEQATYWQCFLWLAQKRIGTQDPVLVNRSASAGWPAPILESLRGNINETELTDAVKSEHDEHRQHEILAEALFYSGERRMAENKAAEATKYFTAVTNLQVTYFIEHHLATAELSKLRRAGS
jgi:lipoprotein NlpI